MLRFMIIAAALAFAAPAVAQDPHGAHAGMQPASHAGMDHSQHVGPADGSHGITTSPADGAMLMGPPAEFSATFPHPMRLTRVTLQAEGQATTEITVPEASPSAAVSVALPDLAPATYTLAWTAQGSDGHEMSGTTEFMVH